MTEKVIITGESSITKLIVATLINDGIECETASALSAGELLNKSIQESNRKNSKRRIYNLKEVQ